MSATQQTSETAGAMLAKAAPPASVSVATLLGIPVSELVLWATLLYTMLMIVHKTMAIYRDMRPCRVDLNE
jgi:hypothetical protein